MGMVALDTLKLARRLREAGLPPEQAEAIAEAQAEALDTVVSERLATKGDLHAVREELHDLRVEMERRFGEMERRFVEQTRWIAGLLVAQAAAIVALIRLLG